MKKKTFIFVLCFVVILNLCSCKDASSKISKSSNNSSSNLSSNINTTKDPSSVLNTNNKESIISSINDSSNIVTSSNKNNKEYFGTFVIEKYIPTGNIEAFSRSSATDYVGEKITVSKDLIDTSNGRIYDPNFKITILDNNNFFKEWNITFAQAKIEDTDVREVEVTNYKSPDNTDDCIGSVLIFTKSHKVYTFVGRALFELKKL